MFAQTPTVALTQIKVDGSEPPHFSNWDSCVRDLGGKVYDESAAKACLNSIIATKYFTGGRIATEPYEKGEISVVFHLEAPSLRVSRLDIKVPDSERERLMKWLSQDERTLRTGDVYQRDGEFATWFGIDNFYRAEGKHVGISETLRLNYQDKTAVLSYKILHGPSMPKEAILPPYSPPCKEIVGILNLTGVDDYVPIALIDSLMKTQAFSCFRRDSMMHDRSVLENSDLFKDVKYSVTGPPNYRQVYVTIVGKPLTVKEVSVQRYGAALGIPLPSPEEFSVRVGSVYSQSKAAADINYLKHVYAKPGKTIDVFEHEDLLPGNLLRVRYDVLAYDSTQFFVDGKEVAPVSSASPSTD